MLAFVTLLPHGISVWIFQLHYFPGKYEDGPAELSVSRRVLSGVASQSIKAGERAKL